MECLTIKDISKSYGKNIALNSINLVINQGERVALLGSNGAGKSTLVNICAGLRSADHGKVLIFGKQPTSQEVKQNFSLLPQTLEFPNELKVKEIIDLVSSHFSDARTNEFIQELQLGPLLHKFCNQLSGGEKRRIAFLLTFLGNPKLCILDEPTANIDIENKELIYKFLKKYYLNQNNSLIFTSHQMGEVEKVADRIVVLHQGKVVLDDNVESTKKSFSLMRVQFNCAEQISPLKNVSRFTQEGDLVSVLTDNSDLTVKEICEKGVSFTNLEIDKPNLEEIILKLWKNK